MERLNKKHRIRKQLKYAPFFILIFALLLPAEGKSTKNRYSKWKDQSQTFSPQVIKTEKLLEMLY